MKTKERIEQRREIPDKIIDNAARLPVESQFLVLTMAKAMQQAHSPGTRRDSTQYFRKESERNV